jgi:hypothetical protein
MSHFGLMPVAFSKVEEYFCITTMSGLLTVAIVRVASARAAAPAAKSATPRLKTVSSISLFPPFG